MRISRNAFFTYLINIIKLILTLLIQISESNLIRRYPGGGGGGKHHELQLQHNPTIYVKVGDSINISCLFDPDVILVNHNNNGKNHHHQQQQLYGYTSYGQGKPLGPQQQPFSSDGSIDDQNTLGDGDSSSIFSNYNFDNFMSRKRRQSAKLKSKHHHGGRGSGLTSTTRSDGGGHRLLEEEESNKQPGPSYELDWFFLNKHGVMNIISYGNKTASNKYQLFMSQEDDESSSSSSSLDDSESTRSQLSSYSSYSQTHSRSAGGLLRKSPSTTTTTFTHYLNVLIESEADEGVYQCINPNLANFIIRNVTVLFERNGQCKLVPAGQSFCCYWLCSLLLIAYQFINYLFK